MSNSSKLSNLREHCWNSQICSLLGGSVSSLGTVFAASIWSGSSFELSTSLVGSVLTLLVASEMNWIVGHQGGQRLAKLVGVRKTAQQSYLALCKLGKCSVSEHLWGLGGPFPTLLLLRRNDSTCTSLYTPPKTERGTIWWRVIELAVSDITLWVYAFHRELFKKNNPLRSKERLKKKVKV